MRRTLNTETNNTYSAATYQTIKITNESHKMSFHSPILSFKCKYKLFRAGGFLISRESGYRIMYRSSSQGL